MVEERNGARLTSARAFLRPARDQPNLHIMLNSTAARILINSGSPKKTVSGVEFLYNNKLYTVRVKKEVVVSAGAVNSPQILLLSGIGPKEELAKVNIQQVHELPGVGKNLHNHVTFYLTFLMKQRKAVNDLDWAAALDYILNRKGPMSSTGMSQVTARINSKYADPSGTHPDLQIFFAGYLAHCAQSGEVRAVSDPEKPDASRTLTISPVVLHPKSRGHISLKSKNPLDAPLMYAGYLKEPEDVAVLIEGVRVVQRLSRTKALGQKYRLELMKEEYGDCETKHRFDTDDYWQCAIRYYTGPENHQAGSCKMGPPSDRFAVVDPQLQVYGIEGLRVMDASIMPTLVSGNTQGTCFVIAEKGVQAIKEKWGQATPITSRFGDDNQSRPSQVIPSSTYNQKQDPYKSHHHYQWDNWHHQGSQSFQHDPEWHRQHPSAPNPWARQQSVPTSEQSYMSSNSNYMHSPSTKQQNIQGSWQNYMNTNYNYAQRSGVKQ